MLIKAICICGAGTMGRGIALNAMISKIPVFLFETNPEILLQASNFIQGELSKRSLLENSSFTNSLFTGDIRDCRGNIFIEAIVESAEEKIALYENIFLHFPHAMIASNTSSLSINQLSASLSRPENFAGMHFFNPAHKMKLVELIAGEKTSDQTIRTLEELAGQLGKTAVHCKDSPGFIVNRVARPYYLEALYLVEKGIVSIEETDKLLEAAGFKMGPFRLMDLIGNDINYTVTCSVYESMKRPERLKPSAMQEQLVASGKLGRKTGKGYYSYDAKE